MYDPCGLDVPPQWSGGPSASSFYAFPQRSLTPAVRANNVGKKNGADKLIVRSAGPITTGTSVFAIQCEDGVVMAADSLISYGSLARFSPLPRMLKVNDSCILAFTGDYADFQYLKAIIEQKQIDDDLSQQHQDISKSDHMKPEAVHHWLTRILYHRRSKFDPLWTTLVVGGIGSEEAGSKPYLGYVNYLGVAYQDECISTGIGADLATPIMRDAIEAKRKLSPNVENSRNIKLTVTEAKSVIERCVRTCFYRDCRATDKFNLGYVLWSSGQAVVEDLRQIDTDWSVAPLIRGFE